MQCSLAEGGMAALLQSKVLFVKSIALLTVHLCLMSESGNERAGWDGMAADTGCLEARAGGEGSAGGLVPQSHWEAA